MTINLVHSVSSVTEQVKVGFSWTTLFFGFFVPVLRGDFKWAIIMFLVACFTFGFSWLVFPFFYNKIYIKAKLMSGYKPSDEGSRDILREKGILIVD